VFGEINLRGYCAGAKNRCGQAKLNYTCKQYNKDVMKKGENPDLCGRLSQRSEWRFEAFSLGEKVPYMHPEC
jgi:hypothetical protein